MFNIKIQLKILVSTSMFLSMLAMPVWLLAADNKQVKSVYEAFNQADVDFHLRYRYEGVDVDNGLKDTYANTVRSRVTFTTAGYKDFSLLLEVEDTTSLSSEKYNSKTNGEAQYQVIADPTDAEFNQATLRYRGIKNTTVAWGRQRITLDNQRFVGGVAWRQNEQTYDSLLIANTSLKDTTVVYAHIDNVNTILGGDIDGGSHHVLNIKHGFNDRVSVTGYAYLLENISDTYGFRLVGLHKKGKYSYPYSLEYANQSDDGSAANYDADYWHVSAGVKRGSVSLKLGFEQQGSDGGLAAFSTPLGTNHKFGGWADKFLATPAAGLEDLYLSLSAKLFDLNIGLSYHDFEAESGGADYGDEVDFVIKKKFNKHYQLLLKYANYSANDFAQDTEKMWLQLTVNY